MDKRFDIVRICGYLDEIVDFIDENGGAPECVMESLLNLDNYFLELLEEY